MLRLTLLITLATVGCGSSTDPTPKPASAPVSGIATDGERFDPAVDTSEIPDGAWMCDMGTVHYAAGEKHDGKCPVCGMKLTQKK